MAEVLIVFAALLNMAVYSMLLFSKPFGWETLAMHKDFFANEYICVLPLVKNVMDESVMDANYEGSMVSNYFATKCFDAVNHIFGWGMLILIYCNMLAAIYGTWAVAVSSVVYIHGLMK